VQTLVKAGGAIALALLFFSFMFAAGSCSGDACMGFGIIFVPMCAFIVVIFCAGVATWRSDRDREEGLSPGFKAVVWSLGIVSFLILCFVFLRMTA
jgi:hypothetical protein